MWKYTGKERPPFAEKPGLNEESVWDYPRPPRVENVSRLVEVKERGRSIASTHNARRVLETASPPTFYLPPEDVRMDLLQGVSGQSFCEWKGAARYWGLVDRPELGAVGWSYQDPSPAFISIKDYISFYPALLECYVDGERVRPQPGSFYGGWVTSELAGPFKGEPGTEHW